MSRAIPAYDPRRRPMRGAVHPPRALPERTHVAVDADRAHAMLAGYGDVGTTLPALAAALRWTQQRTRVALTALAHAGRATRTPAGTWLATEAL